MEGVSRSCCKIWRAWAAYALLASVCDLKGDGGLWTNLSHVSLAIEYVDEGHSIPDGQRKYRPGHPWLQGAIANPAQQGRRVVETPFVTASQVAVLDLVCQELEWI